MKATEVRGVGWQAIP